MAKWGKQPRPRATHRGMLRVGGDIEIPCYVLENGTRVISGRGITTAIGMKGRGQGMQRIGQLRIINPYIAMNYAWPSKTQSQLMMGVQQTCLRPSATKLF